MPVILPYAKRPPHVELGLLTDLGLVIDEHGNQRRPDQCEGLLVYASVETVGALLAHGAGEALTWDGVPKRWRPEVMDEEQWVNRRSDVSVLALTTWPADVGLALKGLAAWRDWLESYGAHPTHSMGGSAISLLRATLKSPVWTMRGDPPPFGWVMGPRIYLPEYVQPMTSYRHAVHVDLQAAYPRAMALLPYGDAIWRHRSAEELGRAEFEQRNIFTPLVLRAKVKLPELPHGVLPDRPLELADVPKGDWDRCELLDGAAVARFPRTVRGWLEGVWCWDELRVAVAHGAELKVEEGWILQNDGTEPFWAWWQAVEAGRKLPRFGGQLAKSCSNACWGALVPSRGARQVVSQGRPRRLPELPRRPSSFDLAELITSRVRALGAQMMLTVGERLLSYHTDGGWLSEAVTELPYPWVVKGRADQLDIIDPQAWRYWPRGKGDPLYTIAGVPADRQEEWWREVWTGAPARQLAHGAR